jgi:hypothetical protein
MAEQDLDAIAFPKLDDEQIAKLGRYAGRVCSPLEMCAPTQSSASPPLLAKVQCRFSSSMNF